MDKLKKIKYLLLHLIIITFPIMIMLEPKKGFKINTALGDIFLAFFVGLVSLEYLYLIFKKEKQMNIKSILKIEYLWYFVGMIVWTIISYVHAEMSETIQTVGKFGKINEILKFVIVGIYFYVGKYTFKQEEKKQTSLLRTWMYTSGFVALIGFLNLIANYTGKNLNQSMFLINKSNRLMGTFTDPNMAGIYFAVSLFVTLMYLRVLREKKFLKIGFLCINFVALILTQSRTAYLTVFVGIIIYILFEFNFKQLRKMLLLCVLILPLIYSLFLNIDYKFLNQSTMKMIDERIEDIYKGTGQSDIRTNLIKASAKMGMKNLVFGVGRSNYPLNSEEYYIDMGIDIEARNYGWTYKIYIPHNVYTGFFAELGLIGILLYLALVLKLIWRVYKSKEKSILLALIGILLAGGITINLENFRGMWLIFGLVSVFNLETQFEVGSLFKTNKIKLNRKILLVYLILFTISFSYNALNYKQDLILNKETKIEVIENLNVNEEYVFRLNLKNENKTSNKAFEINIYEIDENQEKIINQREFYQPNGQFNLIFTPTSDKVRIEIKDIEDEFESKIYDCVLVNMESFEGIDLFEDYRFLSSRFEKKVRKEKFEVNRHDYKVFKNQYAESGAYKNLDSETIYYNGKYQIDLGNIIFTGVTFIEEENVIRFGFINKVECSEINYIWLHGAVNDKGISSENRDKYRFENWDFKLSEKYIKEKVGKEYFVDRKINIKNGEYYLKFGFLKKEGDKYEMCTTRIDLGILEKK